MNKLSVNMEILRLLQVLALTANEKLAHKIKRPPTRRLRSEEAPRRFK